jgi:ribosomal protein S12 methylthiotransferase
MKIYIETLGCPKNEADSQTLKGYLASDFEISLDDEEADIVLINTCAFIQDAQKQSIDTILYYVLEWKNRSTTGKRYVFVWGCLVQRFYRSLLKEIPEADGMIGVVSPERIVEALKRYFKDAETGKLLLQEKTPDTDNLSETQYCEFPPFYSYVKIGDGCNRKCGFCSIPSFKGRHRSRPEGLIVSEIRDLVQRGKKEIILVDQDTTQYSGNSTGLPGLLKTLDSIEGDFWIRVLYTHPDHVDSDLFEVFQSAKKILPYFDIPIQHASDRILYSMNRVKVRQELRDLFGKIREMLPESTIRSTVMVGYPGETDEDFRILVDFITEIQFDRLGVFCFSKEKDSPVAKNRNEKIPVKVARERAEQIMGVQKTISFEKNQRLIGKPLRVLIESFEDNYIGRTYRDAPDVDGLFTIRSEEVLSEGRFYDCNVTEADEYDLGGTVL